MIIMELKEIQDSQENFDKKYGWSYIIAANILNMDLENTRKGVIER